MTSPKINQPNKTNKARGLSLLLAFPVVVACLALLPLLAPPVWSQVPQLPVVPGPISMFFLNNWGTPVGPGESNLKAGPLEIHPFVGGTETYDDNIYRSYGGKPKEADWVSTISPGMQLRLPLQQHSFQ